MSREELKQQQIQFEFEHLLQRLCSIFEADEADPKIQKAAGACYRSMIKVLDNDRFINSTLFTAYNNIQSEYNEKGGMEIKINSETLTLYIGRYAFKYFNLSSLTHDFNKLNL